MEKCHGCNKQMPVLFKDDTCYECWKRPPQGRFTIEIDEVMERKVRHYANIQELTPEQFMATLLAGLTVNMPDPERL